MTRTDRWTTALVIQCACTGMVALGAAYASYRHGRVFALRFGGDPTTASIWPLIVDGLLTIATVELWKTGHDTGRRIAWVAFGFGICLSLCANVGSTEDHTVFGVIVAASPPLALLLAVELLNRSLRRRRAHGETDETTKISEGDLVSEGLEGTAEQRMWQHYLREHARGRVPTGADLDRVANTSNYGRRILRTWKATGRLDKSGRPLERLGLVSADPPRDQRGCLVGRSRSNLASRSKRVS
ncbi:DUF2637 domain-containing protein [Amycolatopsis sp. NPDC003865]